MTFKYWNSILVLALFFLILGDRASVFSEQKTTHDTKATATKNISKIVINVPARELQVYSTDNKLIHKYPVGVGRLQFPTPMGEYHILRKVENPAWENPYKPAGASRVKAGKGNPLGTRWLGFKRDKKGEYGIHGTNRPQSVGQFSSHGCVRMKIKDSEELFSMVSVGTAVEVSYNNAWIESKNKQVLVTLFPNPFPSKKETSLSSLKTEIQERFPNANIDEAKLASLFKNPSSKATVIGSNPVSPLKKETKTVKEGSNTLLDELSEFEFSDVMKN